MRFAGRVGQVPPYMFAQISRKKAALVARGIDLIDLGVGDPDRPSPPAVVQELALAAQDPATHRYPDYEGHPAFRKSVADYYRRRFGVELCPDNEVMTVIGSKEGLSHLVWALVGPGDVALVPDPAYPVYRVQTLLAGGTPYPMPLRAERGFLPDFDAIPGEVLSRARVMFLNYPNNPTAAVAPLEFLARAVDFCRQHQLVLCHDAAYVEMTYDGYTAPSVLQVAGAREVAVEFYSLSKPFNMTGWRLGAVVGNHEVIYGGLGTIKTNTDSGQFDAVQRAGARALGAGAAEFMAAMNAVYDRRRKVFVAGLRAAGLTVELPVGTFYIWVRVPPGHDGASLTELLLEKAQVVVTPGGAYGEEGRGYIRFALTVEEDRLAEAARRIQAALAV